MSDVRATPNPAAPDSDAPPRPRSARRAWTRVATVLALLVLVPVVLVTVLRFVDVRGGVSDTLVSATPYAVFGALVAGALAALGRSVLTGAAAGVLFVVHVVLLAPLFLPGGPTVRGYETTVMTVNLKYGAADPDRIVELVRDRQVDVLAAQELTPAAVEALDRAGLDEALPHRHIRPVANSPVGSGLWSRRPLEPREFGNTERTAFTNLRAIARTRGGVEVDLMAVHPFPPLPATSAPWRRDIGELVRVGEPGDRPMIMLGDFNATRDHAPMRELAGQGLTDAADQAGAGYGPTWGPGGLPRLFEIDHVLVSDDDINASGLSRHEVEGTDHAAVIAELTISEATAPEHSGAG